MDEEQGTREAAAPAAQPQPAPEARRPTIVANPDLPLPEEVLSNLRTFRHLIGITTDPSLGAAQNAATARPGTRPAPNIGLYTRVVHNEQIAKRGFKYYSVLINGCLGLQIVVAAALTAMGAANSNHNAVTAFGAINTIIAGFLTYLKGSGLPNRLNYFHNEWKKLREYIEQRERDLSRPSGAYLDVYAIVNLIERMYEEAKTDVEVNTPDGYISISNVRGRPALERPGSLALTHVDTSKNAMQALDQMKPDLLRGSTVSSRFKGLEAGLAEKLHEANTLRNSVAEKLHEVDNAKTQVAHEAETARADLTERLHDADQARQDATRDLERGEHAFSARIRELRGSIDERVRDLTSTIDQSTRNVARDIESQGRQTSAQAREVESGAIEEVSRDIQEHAKRKIDELAARLSH